MGKKYFKPYGIDIDYEYETYKNVGRDYNGISQIGIIKKWKKQRRKVKYPYEVCDTYSVWKEHVEIVLQRTFTNYEDMIHWLYQKRNNAKAYLDMAKTILIPIYIAILSFSDLFFASPLGGVAKLIVMSAICGMIIYFSVKIVSEAEEKVDFFNDFIKIAEEKTNK